MHTTRFNRRRFAALLRSDWEENRNTYLMFLTGAYVVAAIALTAIHIDLYAETLPVKEVLDQREGLLPGIDRGGDTTNNSFRSHSLRSCSSPSGRSGQRP